jgi:uncharacterized protein YeaO (DUF488 family)
VLSVRLRPVTIFREDAVPIRIVRLGGPRFDGEGVRLGTVRRPPRGVPKREFAAQNWYDVWFPNLAPSVETMHLGQQATTPKEWERFARRYRAEMSTPDNARTLDVLAALSHATSFSVGCYCADESRCHRSVLRALLVERDADVVAGEGNAGRLK